MEILTSKSQLNIFGYDKIFKLFVKLYKKNNIPNVILLSGEKGLGKSTFVYHFINYLLSKDEENKYSYENFKINSNNLSYKLMQNNIHPNFFLLENNLNDENIKIDQVRELIKFLNISTYSKDLKLVLIDNIEYLNLNSSNALLKSLEEPKKNTFFFIIHNSSFPIMETIKSRSVQFKFYFNIPEKKNIFKKIFENYSLNYNYNYKYNDKDLDKFLYFETPGNLLKYLIDIKDLNLNIFEGNLSCIQLLIEKHKNKKDSKLLNLITILIENFYNRLSFNNINNINHYFINKSKIANLISDTRKFNLDKKNLFITIDEILRNEA